MNKNLFFINRFKEHYMSYKGDNDVRVMTSYLYAN